MSQLALAARSKLSGSLLSTSASNTNNLGINTTVNFDFTLIKFSAPVEFTGLGLALSSKRRKEAEDGAVHVVARKLAVLFADELPATPRLIEAYGKRASEIAEMPGINPRGAPSHGPFREFAGVDATTIWAAATASKDAISVGIYLLACMLARIYKASEAVAVWTEIVEGRKRLLQKAFEETVFHINDLSASQISLRCDELAQWDASARSWLDSGDAALARKHLQAKLIINNIGLTMRTGPNVYKHVLEAWKAAMVSVESLILGMPHTVNSAEVLLGISSWHLYPDMVVLRGQTRTIEFHDDLVPGIITIGLQSPDSTKDLGIVWSLPLSHLKYYGKPVIATGSVAVQSSRVSIDKFMYVVFGCVISSWKIGQRDLNLCARFFIALRTTLESRVTGRGNTSTAVHPWMTVVCNAAQKFRELDGPDRAEAERLIGLGQRRLDSFLSESKSTLPFALGLSDPETYLQLLRGSETKIAWIRSFFKQHFSGQSQGLGGRSEQPIIGYKPSTGDHHYVQANDILSPSDEDCHDFRHHPIGLDMDYEVGRVMEWATVFPFSGPPLDIASHGRWVQHGDQHGQDAFLLSQFPNKIYQLPRGVAERVLQLNAETDEYCGIWINLYEHEQNLKRICIDDGLGGVPFDAMPIPPMQGAYLPRPRTIRAFGRSMCHQQDAVDHLELTESGSTDLQDATHSAVVPLNMQNPYPIYHDNVEAVGVSPRHDQIMEDRTLTARASESSSLFHHDIRNIPRRANEIWHKFSNTVSNRGLTTARSPTPQSVPHRSRIPAPTPLVETHELQESVVQTTSSSSFFEGFDRCHELEAPSYSPWQKGLLARGHCVHGCEDCSSVVEPTSWIPARCQPSIWDCSELKDHCPYLWYISLHDETAINHNPYKMLRVVLGHEDSVSVYVKYDLLDEGWPERLSKKRIPQLTLANVVEALEEGKLDPVPLSSYLSDDEARLWNKDLLSTMQSLESLQYAMEVYGTMSSRQVDLSVANTPLQTFHWTKKGVWNEPARAMACIATFESGGLNFDPGYLGSVFAMSAANSLYVANELCSDPWDTNTLPPLKHIIGNVGKPGIVFLVAPYSPEMEDVARDFTSWRQVTHAEFDGRYEDNFAETSVHLSFTGYERALNVGEHGYQFQEATFVETAVKVYTSDRWVADLDVLGAFSGFFASDYLDRLPERGCCAHEQKDADDFDSVGALTSVDNWSELADHAINLSIVRVRRNWLARLATAVVGLQKGRPVIVGQDRICWACVAENPLHLHDAALVIC